MFARAVRLIERHRSESRNRRDVHHVPVVTLAKMAADYAAGKYGESAKPSAPPVASASPKPSPKGSPAAAVAKPKTPEPTTNSSQAGRVLKRLPPATQHLRSSRANSLMNRRTMNDDNGADL